MDYIVEVEKLRKKLNKKEFDSLIDDEYKKVYLQELNLFDKDFLKWMSSGKETSDEIQGSSDYYYVFIQRFKIKNVTLDYKRGRGYHFALIN